MSYLQWDGHYQRLLDGWVATVSAKLVAVKRYEDMMSLMDCLNNFELLSSIAIGFDQQVARDEAHHWLNLKISELAGALSGLGWNSRVTNDDVYGLLQDISEFVRINDLANAVATLCGPQKQLSPASRSIRIKLDF